MGICGSSDDVMNPKEVDLSHFEVGACIGKGGFGKVHAVIHKGTSNQMAMKLLIKSKIVTKQWHIDTVWVERNLLELIDSPYINKLYFAFQNDRLLYVIMPYMRGGDLGWYLHKKGKMKNEAIRYYAAQLLLGLSELRQLNVVYRDFKPENCLFNDDGNICLTDFGICGRLTKENNYMLCDRIGTVPYMSHQQFLGEPYNYCADYFAYGLTLYEMGTNKKLLRVPRNLQHETAHYFNQHLHHLSNPNLQDLVRQLLNLKREKRIGVNDIQEIFSHPFFNGINFDQFRKCQQTMKPPYKPDVTQFNCHLSNFAADAFGHDSVSEIENIAPPPSDKQKIFNNFEYNTNTTEKEIEHWEKCKQENGFGTKKWDQYLTDMWEKPIDPNAVKPPKSSIDYQIVKDIPGFDIRKSMLPQIKHATKKDDIIASHQHIHVDTTEQ